MNETNSAQPHAVADRAYRLDGIAKRYGAKGTQVHAIDGVDLSIDKGEFVVIVGPSGSGKSTLLQMLGALDRPSDGEVEFAGRDFAQLTDRELADVRLNTIGFVFQQFNLVPTLTAAENIELAMAPAGLAAEQRATTVAALLGRVGLSERGDHLPSQLSGGEQQRVAIARALANDPDVLLADEPTGNLDSTTGEVILEMLFELWRETNLTVVLITHDAAIAERAPRVVHLSDGRVTEDTRVETRASGREEGVGP